MRKEVSQRRIPSQTGSGPGAGRPESPRTPLTITARLVTLFLNRSRGINRNILSTHDSLCRNCRLCETFENRGYAVLDLSKVVPKVVICTLSDTRFRLPAFSAFFRIAQKCRKCRKCRFARFASFRDSSTPAAWSTTLLFQKVTESPFCAKWRFRHFCSECQESSLRRFPDPG